METDKAGVVLGTVAEAEIEKFDIVSLDPPVSIFNVTLRTAMRGIWMETFGCEEELRIFLRGVRAGCELNGGTLREVEIPRRGKKSRLTPCS